MDRFMIVHESDLEGFWETEQAAVEAAKRALGEQGNDEPFIVVEAKKRVRASYVAIVEDP